MRFKSFYQVTKIYLLVCLQIFLLVANSPVRLRIPGKLVERCVSSDPVVRNADKASRRRKQSVREPRQEERGCVESIGGIGRVKCNDTII